MTRWIITGLALAAIAALSSAPGCASTGVGDPCVPDEEYDQTFQGFNVGEVSVESKSYVCLSRLCLVNHFQGRVTCPYGQTAPNTGTAGPAGSPAAAVYSQFGCGIPGSVPGPNGYSSSDVITATNAVTGLGTVPPQITSVTAGPADRTANKAVYCSCRCANVDGNTNDGDVYCSCPSGYSCTQLVSSIGSGDTGLTGAYCVLDGTQYEPSAPTNDTCTATVTSPGEGYCPLQY